MVSAIAELLMAKQAPRGMLEADEVIATTAAAQDSLSEDVPPPPYTEEHICTNDAAVACDHPECKYTATSWGAIVQTRCKPTNQRRTRKAMAVIAWDVFAYAGNKANVC